MKKTFTCEVTFESKDDLYGALLYAAKLVSEGYLAGDLRNESIEFGSFDIKEEA